MAKPIYILCLHNVRTGGPEAIHQLSDALIEQGFDARMVYYDWQQIARLEKAPTQDGYTFGERTNPIGEYERYKVNICGHVPNVSGVVVVLPETLCHLAPKFDKATVLVWWLSVDNAFGALAKVNLNHLRAPNVRHGAQSAYADHFLIGARLPPSFLLSDYTTDLTEYATPLPPNERGRTVLLNANQKVTADIPALMDAIHKLDSTIECIPLRGLSRATLAHHYATARLYADFGSFPGKDRGPREAAHMGCNVMVGPFGAADEFTFAGYRETWENPVEIRAINIATAVNTYGGAFAAPNIRKEREHFFMEVRIVFREL